MDSARTRTEPSSLSNKIIVGPFVAVISFTGVDLSIYKLFYSKIDVRKLQTNLLNIKYLFALLLDYEVFFWITQSGRITL